MESPGVIARGVLAGWGVSDEIEEEPGFVGGVSRGRMRMGVRVH